MTDRIVWFLIYVLVVAFVYSGAVVLDIVLDAVKCEAPVETSWSPPNVQLCPEEMGLWECVRDAAYREDI